ncbi:hypothetical protein NLO74_23265 [Pseudomonas tremae]|uniref:hypothetical protein n=1 Tax=Pseudomonas tremae TaxID=200454 RepID=UPI0021092C83|nr:hypothetical protein [Pseudomonas tremae]MCQ3028910.1 hypothetical protein [Pseudomonas tremae]
MPLAEMPVPVVIPRSAPVKLRRKKTALREAVFLLQIYEKDLHSSQEAFDKPML